MSQNERTLTAALASMLTFSAPRWNGLFETADRHILLQLLQDKTKLVRQKSAVSKENVNQLLNALSLEEAIAFVCDVDHDETAVLEHWEDTLFVQLRSQLKQRLLTLSHQERLWLCYRVATVEYHHDAYQEGVLEVLCDSIGWSPHLKTIIGCWFSSDDHERDLRQTRQFVSAAVQLSGLKSVEPA